MNYRQITWLASYPKSGNTWLRCFLDAYYLGELDINELLCSMADDRSQKQQLKDGTDIAIQPIEIQQLTKPYGMVNAVREYVKSNTPMPFYVKTHAAHLLANGVESLSECLTRSTIHIVRDPRDVLPSFANHMGSDIDQAIEWMQDKYRVLKGTDEKVADLISSWDFHTNSFLNADTHNVRTFLYEDLRANPLRVFAEMLEHVGETPDLERVEKAVEITNLESLRKREKAEGFREASPKAINPFFHKGQVGGWKDSLTDLQLHKVEKAFGRVMKRLGYIKKRRVA